MIRRFQRIREELGGGALVKTLVQVVGLVVTSVIGVEIYSSYLALSIAVFGVGIGFLMRKYISSLGIDSYTRVMQTGLYIYGIVLLLGDRFGLDRNVQLCVITATTAGVFNLNYWLLSDPESRLGEDGLPPVASLEKADAA